MSNYFEFTIFPSKIKTKEEGIIKAYICPVCNRRVSEGITYDEDHELSDYGDSAILYHRVLTAKEARKLIIDTFCPTFYWRYEDGYSVGQIVEFDVFKQKRIRYEDIDRVGFEKAGRETKITTHDEIVIIGWHWPFLIKPRSFKRLNTIVYGILDECLWDEDLLVLFDCKIFDTKELAEEYKNTYFEKGYKTCFHCNKKISNKLETLPKWRFANLCDECKEKIREEAQND